MTAKYADHECISRRHVELEILILGRWHGLIVGTDGKTAYGKAVDATSLSDLAQARASLIPHINVRRGFGYAQRVSREVR